MKFICAQCKKEFALLKDFSDHLTRHSTNMTEFIKAVLEHFYPTCCPHCENYLELPSDTDIEKFIQEG